jgi:hypothetical protein
MIAVTYGLARFAYGLFLPEMRESLGLSETILGLIGALQGRAAETISGKQVVSVRRSAF